MILFSAFFSASETAFSTCNKIRLKQMANRGNERAEKVLNDHKKPMNGSKVLVLGVAYKNDIDDYRESPALKVIEELEKNKACVDFYDPMIPEYKYKGENNMSKKVAKPKNKVDVRWDVVITDN